MIKQLRKVCRLDIILDRKTVKLLGFLLVYLLYTSSLFGEGIKGVYSCSSGKNNYKPIIYIFNQKLMLRDNNKEFPFEYISSLKSGELIYVGLTKHENYDSIMGQYGACDDCFDGWLKQNFTGKLFMAADGLIDSGLFTQVPKKKADFLINLDATCEAEKLSNMTDANYSQSQISFDLKQLVGKLYKSIQELDKSSNTHFDNLKTTKKPKKFCKIARDFAFKQGISSSREHLLKRNFKFAYSKKISALFDKTLISINLNTEIVLEKKVGKTETGKKYNCSTIDLEVPEIKEAENSILDETT